MSSPASTHSLHDSLFDYEIDHKPAPAIRSKTGFFDLPAEIRTNIYELVLDVPACYAAAFTSGPAELNPDYRASSYLQPLLVCHQLYADAHLLALSRTLFVVSNPYLALDIGNHMASRLRPASLAALRHLAFVADSRHFRKLRAWRVHAFGQPGLRLERLSIVLHRSSYWHYLFDYNAVLVNLLRGLEGVDNLAFVRNDALIKGTLLTWYNRLVMLILKTDRAERFGRSPGVAEEKWWDWDICHESQMVSLSARPAKRRDLCLEEYDQLMAPLHRALVQSMECEEEDPDPMSRTSA